jgi:hypothetical protein
MSKDYMIRKNPEDKLWYVLGKIRAQKPYWMVVSNGYKHKTDAAKWMSRQPFADADAIRSLLLWDGK